MKMVITKGILGAILLMGFASSALAGSVMVWTNTAGGNWKNAANWEGSKAPGGGDTAIITNAGNYTVTLDANVDVGNLVLGGAAGMQILEVGSMRLRLKSSSLTSVVQPHGQLNLSGGTIEQEALTVAGALNWTAGQIKAPLNILAGGRVELSGLAPKFFGTSGATNVCGLTNYGTVVWSDLGGLQLYEGTVVHNEGLFQVANDLELAGTNTFSPVFLNVGTFQKVAGPGATRIGDIIFQGGGTIDVQSGYVSFPTGKQTLADGTRVTGAGALRIDGAEITLNGTITVDTPVEMVAGKFKGNNTIAGGLKWSGGSLEGTTMVNGVLNWQGGKSGNPITVNGAVNLSAGEIAGGPITINGDFNWTGGSITTDKLTVNGNTTWSGGVLTKVLPIATGRQLLIQEAGTKTIDGGLIENRGTTIFIGAGSVLMEGGAEFLNYGTTRVDNDTPITGAACTSCKFYNYGTLAKTSSGMTAWQTVQLFNQGTLDLQAGMLQLTANSHTFEANSSVTGAGSLQVAGASLTIRSNVVWQPALELNKGCLLGNASVETDILWREGTLDATFNIPLGRQLILSGSGTKILAKDAVLNVWGGMQFADRTKVQFYANATINNYGLVEIQSDNPFDFNGSDKAWFKNYGTLQRTGANKELQFDQLQLVNSGTLDLQTAGIVFKANTHSLQSGSQCLGPVRVDGATLQVNGEITNTDLLGLNRGYLIGNATFSGGLDFSGGELEATLVINGPLTWSGGLLSGGVTANAPVAWSGGELKGTFNLNNSMEWSGGTLTSSLTIGAGNAMTVLPGGTKLITGTLNNAGTVTVVNNGQIQVVNGTPFLNSGLFEVQSQTPFKVNGTAKPVFNNSGTLRRSVSTTTLDFGALLLNNAGTLDVQSSRVTFSANNHTLADGARLTGPAPCGSRAQRSRGTIASAPKPLRIGGGYLLGNANVTGNLTMSGGQLPGVVAVSDQFTWSGGEVKGTLTAATTSRGPAAGCRAS